MRHKRLLRTVAVLLLVVAMTGLLAPASLAHAPEGVQGPQGVQGVQGPQGLPGVQGPPGLTPDDFEAGVSWWGDSPDRGYPAGIYRTEGGKKLVAPTGTEIELENGSTLTAQAGSTVVFGASPVFTATLTVQTLVVSDTASVAGLTASVNVTAEGALVGDIVSEFTPGAGVTVDEAVFLNGSGDFIGNITTTADILADSLTVQDATITDTLDAAGVSASVNVTAEGALVGDVVSEFTANNGVAVDSLVIKDAGLLAAANITTTAILVTDEIDEYTADNGIDIDGATFKDSGGDFGANVTTTASLIVDTVSEYTAEAGVTVGGVLLQDGAITTTSDIVVAFGSLLYASEILESFADEGVNIEGSSLVDGDITAGAALTVTTSADVGTWLLLEAQAVITATNGGTLSATGSNQPITSTGNVGLDDITLAPAGSYLELHNASANTITITDTGVIMLSGDIALGQYDVLALRSDGTNWIQVSTSNN